jgi:nucleoside-diphosphate-sugar epimerase
MMARLFVTGTTGFVGAAVSTRLAARGHALRALVRTDLDALRADELGATHVRADLTEVGRLAEEAARADAVVHCAASDAPAFHPVNHAVVAAMLAALRPGAGFVTHGGSLVFGPTSNAAPGADGTSDYAPPPFLAARATIDRMVRAAGAERDLRTAVIHASFVYGGPGAVLPCAMTSAAREAAVSAFPGDGTARWSAVHVEDWADMIVAAALHAPAGGRAYVAGGRDWSMVEIAALIGQALGLPVTSLDPGEAENRWGPLGPALAVPQVFDNRIARAELGVPAPRDGLAAWLGMARRN